MNELPAHKTQILRAKDVQKLCISPSHLLECQSVLLWNFYDYYLLYISAKRVQEDFDRTGKVNDKRCCVSGCSFVAVVVGEVHLYICYLLICTVFFLLSTMNAV